MAAILGWDVGGANLKAVRIEADGVEPQVFERPVPLWREPQRLPELLTEAAAALGGASQMAVTMTAELADCFATKREGVRFVLDAFRSAFPGVEPWVYGVEGRFRSVADACRAPLRVAAANWMASATLVAESSPDALFIDVGSTTTDVIPIRGGRVVARGRTDPARLRSGELVYTGALRTPVCAIVRWLPWRGRRCRVAAEHFAVSADAHLWLGRIAACDYSCETPDGRGRERAEAGARLEALALRLSALSDFTLEALERETRSLAAELGIKAGEIIGMARVALTGRKVSPGIFEVMWLLGRDRVLARLERAAARWRAETAHGRV